MLAQTRQCIYCLKVLALSAFRNAEHVITRNLGTSQDNFTLDCVCRECNSTLGHSVEWVLATGSLEAVLAIQYGVRSAAYAARLLRDRVSLTYPEGDYKGVHLTFIDRGGDLVIGPMSQVGIARKGQGGFRFFSKRDLSRLRTIPDDIDPNGEKRIIGMSESDAQLLVTILRHRGIPYEHKGSLPIPPGWGKVQANLDFTVDMMVRRCAAKIAFNYMAYAMVNFMESPDPAFIYRADFDTIRRFVRYGTAPPHRLVLESEMPVLHGETLERRQTYGHIVTLEWGGSGTDLMSQVSLFNHITYKVALAPSFSGAWRPIRSGHLFDIRKQRIYPLSGADRSWLILP